MDQQTVKFLIRAKQATYAGKGAETSPSREKSHDLVYRDGEYMYYDTYLGGEEFAGEEALWISGVPHWSMNYIGRVTGENFSGDFLKEALLRVPEENPYQRLNTGESRSMNAVSTAERSGKTLKKDIKESTGIWITKNCLTA